MTDSLPSGFRDVTDEAERIADEHGWSEGPPPHFDSAPPPREDDYGVTGTAADKSLDRTPRWPAPLDLEALSATEPEPPQFIVSDWGPAGYAWLLAGHGGAGKSSIGLHLAVCLAAGVPWCGLEVKRRRVLVLACEDRANVLHWRLRRICDYLDLDMAALAGWLNVVDLVGHDTILWQPADGRLTPAYAALAAHVQETAADVIVVDGVTDAFAGNESDRAEVKAFVNGLLALIHADHGAVLLLGHVNKQAASAAATSEGYSGSTGWHNAVRARWYLYPETRKDEGDDRTRSTGALTLELQKSNLGRTDQTINFRWSDTHHLFVPEAPATGVLAAITEQSERQSILDALAECQAKAIPVPAAAQGRRTAYHVLRATDLLSDKLCTGKPGVKRFWRRIEELRQMQLLRTNEIRRANRHAAEVLELVATANEEVRQCVE